MQALPDSMLGAMAKALDQQNQLTISHIIEDYASFSKEGPAQEIGLRVQSGRYRASIRASKAVVNGQAVSSGIGDNLVYAAIHEFGGVIPAHDVVPKSAGALRFMIGDRVVFANKVHIPDITMPARAPIQHGIEDRLGDYGEALSDAVVGKMQGGK